MDARPSLSSKETQAIVDAFHKIADYQERCRFFHRPENAVLKAIFRESHFPNPDADSADGAQPKTN